MFFAQIMCTIIAGTIQLEVQAWMFGNAQGMYTVDQRDGSVCPSTEVIGTVGCDRPFEGVFEGTDVSRLVFFSKS
jgi:hypothetical protein